MTTESTSALPDAFDRGLAMLQGLPDVAHTKPSTIRTVPTLGVGGTSIFIVQTYRQTHDGGSRDTIFLEHVGAAGTVRLMIPSEVADTIARQRDSLTTKTRSRAAKRVAAERMARGERPAFLRRKPKKRGD